MAEMDRNALGYLTELNRNVESALSLLVKLAEYPELNREDFIVYQSYFRESLSDANLDVIDALEEFEQEAMLKASEQRAAFEKKIRAPDDCYLEVAKREEELREEGEPSRLGLIFSRRRFTREEIMSDTFGDEDETGDEDEIDDEDESDMDSEVNSDRNPSPSGTDARQQGDSHGQ
jgi:hypothetical protein